MIDLLTSNRFIEDFIFDADGALYVMEINDPSKTIDTVTISKVTLVPEPATLLLFGFGTIATALRRRK